MSICLARPFVRHFVSHTHTHAQWHGTGSTLRVTIVNVASIVACVGIYAAVMASDCHRCGAARKPFFQFATRSWKGVATVAVRFSSLPPSAPPERELRLRSFTNE